MRTIVIQKIYSFFRDSNRHSSFEAMMNDKSPECTTSLPDNLVKVPGENTIKDVPNIYPKIIIILFH